MAAGKYNFKIEKGATFTRTFDVSAVFATLVGYAARLKVRPSPTSGTVLVNVSTLTTGLTIDTVNRTITMSLTATETTALTTSNGVYDLEVESGAGVVTRVLEGQCEISAEVTY